MRACIRQTAVDILIAAESDATLCRDTRAAAHTSGDGGNSRLGGRDAATVARESSGARRREWKLVALSPVILNKISDVVVFPAKIPTIREILWHARNARR